MAIKRQMNFLNGMRVDIPHLRAVESSVANDFQVLSGTMMTGTRALIAWGATLLDAGMVGQQATSLFVRMADAVLMHGTSAEAGAIFSVDTATPDDQLVGTNANVVGTWTSGAVNYVSVDFVRAADATTEAPVVFRSNATGDEFDQTVPLARTLRYKLYISINNFAATPTRAPIAKVTVGVAGDIVSIEDARQLFWRLGTGGTVPNPLATFAWANRDEATSTTLFGGGDKDIRSQYDFNRAMMGRLWELAGGEHWYSPVDGVKSVRLVYDPAAVFPNGSNWDWDVGTKTLQWQGLRFLFSNSTATYNTVQDGSFVLANGEVVYVDVDQATDAATVIPVKALATALKSAPPTKPGSRYILAWRKDIGAVDPADVRVYVDGQPGSPVNTPSSPATNTSMGIVQLYTTFTPSPTNPVVPVMNSLSGAGAGQVVARGMTRDVAGNIVIGNGANDTSVVIGGDSTKTHSIIGRLLADATTAAEALFVRNLGTGIGLRAQGASNVEAIRGEAFGTGAGVAGVGGVDGPGGYFTGGANAAAVHLVVRAGAPAVLAGGDVWIQTDNFMKFYDGATVRTLARTYRPDETVFTTSTHANITIDAGSIVSHNDMGECMPRIVLTTTGAIASDITLITISAALRPSLDARYTAVRESAGVFTNVVILIAAAGAVQCNTSLLNGDKLHIAGITWLV